jgi:hypothetical protein
MTLVQRFPACIVSAKGQTHFADIKVPIEIGALPKLQVFKVQTLLFTLTEFTFSSARLK